MDSKRNAYQLIVIPVSHYSEKVRWGLDWLQIPYQEERHVPFFHRIATRRFGGSSVPVLVTKQRSLTDSTDILNYLDEQATTRRLYPTEPTLRQEVEKLEDCFDRLLGVCTRRWAYFYLIGDRALMREAWCKGTPKFEQMGFEVAFPFMVTLLRRLLRLTENGAARSLQEIRTIFEDVNQRLATNNNYLVGDRFSVADITFASLAAPVLFPEEYPIQFPSLDQIPTEMATVIQELRVTPAGQYALRLYQEERYPKPT